MSNIIQTIYFNSQTGEKITIFPNLFLATSGNNLLNNKEEIFFFKNGAIEQAQFVQNLIDEGFKSISVNRKIGIH